MAPLLSGDPVERGESAADTEAEDSDENRPVPADGEAARRGEPDLYSSAQHLRQTETVDVHADNQQQLCSLQNVEECWVLWESHRDPWPEAEGEDGRHDIAVRTGEPALDRLGEPSGEV